MLILQRAVLAISRTMSVARARKSGRGTTLPLFAPSGGSVGSAMIPAIIAGPAILNQERNHDLSHFCGKPLAGLDRELDAIEDVRKSARYALGHRARRSHAGTAIENLTRRSLQDAQVDFFDGDIDRRNTT